MLYGAIPPETELVKVTVCPLSIVVGVVTEIVIESLPFTVIEEDKEALRPSASVTVTLTE